MVRGQVLHRPMTFGEGVAHFGKALAVDAAARATRLCNVYATPQLTVASAFGAARREDLDAFRRCFSHQFRYTVDAEGEAAWATLMAGIKACFRDTSDGVLTPISGDRSQQMHYLGMRYLRGTLVREGALGGWRLDSIG